MGQSTKESNLPILAYAAKLLFISPPHALLFSAGLVELVVLGVGLWEFAGVVGLGTLFFALLLASTPEVGLYVGVYPLAWLGAVGVSLIDLDSVKDRDVWVRVAGLLACTAVWVFAIRFAAPVLDSGPWIIPGLSVVTVGVPLAARWRWDNRRIAWPGSYGYAADKSGLASASRLRSWGK